MRRRQTSSQSSLSKLQTHQGFYEQKPQKPRLEILGSLIFLAGLSLSKPAWSAPEVGSAALSVSYPEQLGGEVVTAAPTEADTIPSHPESLPQVERGEATPIWSQPAQGNVGKTVQEISIQKTAKELLPNPPNSSFLPVVQPLSGELNAGLLNDTVTQEAKKDEQTPQPSVKTDINNSLSTSCLSSSPAAKIDAVESSPTISRVIGQPQTVSPDFKQPCNPQLPNLVVHPTQLDESIERGDARTQGHAEETIHHNQFGEVLVAEGENLSPTEVQPSPSPNSSEPQPPTNGQDPELGNLRLRELAAPPPPSQPSVYLLGGVGYFRSNNIFLGSDPVDDGLFRTGLTLLAVPSLGPQTSLFASVGGNITRYSEQSLYDYNELNFNLGIRQQLGSRTYGELGWNNRQLFSKDSGDRFLDDHSLYLQLGRRDFLTNRLSLDTFYQARLSFANPSDRSQVINYLGASLNYYPSRSLEVALGYQFALADFTQQDRLDQYHQLIARLSYTMSRNSRFYLFGGGSFGHSSDSYVDYDGLFFGAGVDFNLSLF